jgi:hypothetical protein
LITAEIICSILGLEFHSHSAGDLPIFLIELVILSCRLVATKGTIFRHAATFSRYSVESFVFYYSNLCQNQIQMHFGSLSKEIPTKLCKWKNFECSTAHIRQPHSDLCFLINTQTIALGPGCPSLQSSKGNCANQHTHWKILSHFCGAYPNMESPLDLHSMIQQM